MRLSASEPAGEVPAEAKSAAGLDWGAILPATRMGDQLAERMVELIERGEFGIGERLPSESDLAIRFSVSRPVIRDALSRLRVKGMIVSRKGSGSYVQKAPDPPRDGSAGIAFGPFTSLSQVRRWFDFRISLEGDAAYHAAQTCTPELLAAMREALSRMNTAMVEGSVGMNPDIEFHLTVARASGNEFFESVMNAMRTPMEFVVDLARRLTLTRPYEHMLLVQAEHVAICNAIEVKDGNAARRAARAHLHNARWRVFEGPGGAPVPPDAMADQELGLPDR